MTIIWNSCENIGKILKTQFEGARLKVVLNKPISHKFFQKEVVKGIWGRGWNNIHTIITTNFHSVNIIFTAIIDQLVEMIYKYKYVLFQNYLNNHPYNKK